MRLWVLAGLVPLSACSVVVAGQPAPSHLTGDGIMLTSSAVDFREVPDGRPLSVIFVRSSWLTDAPIGASAFISPSLVSPFDRDGNTMVNVGDVIQAKPHYGTDYRYLDFDVDGDVDILDMAQFRLVMLKACPCGDWVDVALTGPTAPLVGFDIAPCDAFAGQRTDLLLADLPGSNVMDFSGGTIAAVDFGPDAAAETTGGILARYRGTWAIGEWTLVFADGSSEAGGGC